MCLHMRSRWKSTRGPKQVGAVLKSTGEHAELEDVTWSRWSRLTHPVLWALLREGFWVCFCQLFFIFHVLIKCSLWLLRHQRSLLLGFMFLEDGNCSENSRWGKTERLTSHIPGVCCCPLQTVLNTMCGYGKQRLEERLARQKIFTVGCLEKIVWWATNNLLLVAGLTGGLLLLEVTSVHIQPLSWTETPANYPLFLWI